MLGLFADDSEELQMKFGLFALAIGWLPAGWMLTASACAQEASLDELKRKIEVLELKLELAEKTVEMLQKECDMLRSADAKRGSPPASRQRLFRGKPQCGYLTS